MSEITEVMTVNSVDFAHPEFPAGGRDSVLG